MTVRQMLTVFDHDNQTADVYVMTEGQISDVAVYKKTVTLAYTETPANQLALDVFAIGEKLTERKALEIMALPEGTHYRR